MRAEEIAAALASSGLEDMIAYFLPRRKSWSRDGRIWSMRRGDKVVRSQTDYLLGIDHRLYQNLSVRDVRHNSDHYLVLGCLQGAPAGGHARYLGSRRRFPLRPPQTANAKDCLFVELRGAVPNFPLWGRVRQAWILPETWRLVDEKIVVRRDRLQQSVRSLGRRINASLRGGRQHRAAEAGASVRPLLASDLPLVKEVWIRMRGGTKMWLTPHPPSRVTIERMMSERVELYRHFPPPGRPIPIEVTPSPWKTQFPGRWILRIRLSAYA